MAIDALVSVGAGLATGSIALLAFGFDSVLELVSAGVLMWRLRMESLGIVPRNWIEQAERQASRVVGWSLLILAAYVVIQSAYNLWTKAAPESSPIGIGLAGAALLVMPALVMTKLRVASAINSPALKGDAACGVVCFYMAATLLVGLILRAWLGWWWADPVAALGIVYFIVREGHEALTAEDGCGCCK